MLSVSDFTHIIQSVLPEPHAGLLSGILFGTKATLDPTLRNALVSTGTLHIIALSGMNITILTGFLCMILTLFIPRRIAMPLTMLGIIGFLSFVGPSASLIRAAIMGSICLLSISLGRQYWALGGWSIAATLMLSYDVHLIGDLSFQLSMLSSLGIILFHRPIRTSFLRHPYGWVYYETAPLGKRIVAYIRSLLIGEIRMTLSAQVLTIPIMVMVFRNISLVSPLTNILIGWTIPLIMGLGFILCILGYIWLPLGQVVAWVTWLFLEYVLDVVFWTSTIPFASVRF